MYKNKCSHTDLFLNFIFWLHLCSMRDPSSPTCARAVEAKSPHLTTGPPGSFLYTFCACNFFVSLYWGSWSVFCLCIQCPKGLFIARNHSLAEDAQGIPIPPPPDPKWFPVVVGEVAIQVQLFPFPLLYCQERFFQNATYRTCNSAEILAKVELQSTLTCCWIPELLLTLNNFLRGVCNFVGPSFAVFLGNFKLIISLFIRSQKIIVRNKWDTVGESSNIMHNWHD